MTLADNNHIGTELLNYSNKYGKVYFMTLLTNIAESCNVSEKDVMEYTQTSFLKSDYSFRYYLTKTRRGIKIAAIKKFDFDPVAIEFLLDNEIKEPLAQYMLSQFLGKLSEIKIKQLTKFYISLLNTFKSDDNDEFIYIAINTNSKNIYAQLSEYNRDEIDEFISLIREHGYSFDRDGMLYWKTYSPKASITISDLEDSFSAVNNSKETISEPPKVIEQVEEMPVVTTNMPLTAKKALSVLAKEFGLSIAEDNSKHKLEELIVMTDELILNFDSLQDWEKLKSWEQFVKDWHSIMGEAMNDRN